MGFDRNLVTAGGVALETFSAGSGAAPICTTHAFVPATSSGGLAAAALSRISKTVAVNVRSLGASDRGQGAALSLEQAVHDLEAVRAAMGYDRWVYAGGSAGGFVGLHYALMFPGSLEALILIGTAASHRAILNPASVYHPAHPDNAKVLTAELEPADGAPQWIQIVWPLLSHVDGPVIEEARRAGPIGVERFRALSAELPHYDLEPRLNDIEVPTLIVHGVHDASMPVSQGHILGERIPHAELVVIEECGHFPFWEQPAAFDDAVRTFLRRTVVRSGERST